MLVIMFSGLKRRFALALAIALLIPLNIPKSSALIRAFDIYMDQPLVQGSYVSPDADAATETFNSYTPTGVDACTDASISVGTIEGTCSVFDSPDYGASSTGSGQSIGGTGSKMISGYPGANYKVNFSETKKYVGFWWAAGSNGNTVNFYSRGAIVASVNVNQVFSMFGTAPYEASTVGAVCYGQSGGTASAVGDKCFGNSMDTNDASAVVTSAGGTKYLKNLYFGNPNGYTPPSGGPSTIAPSSRIFNEPFVYIHAFAANGATFDAVEFSGSGFEIDNLTVARDQKTPRNELVFVQSAPGSYVATFDSQGGSAVTSGAFTSGGTLNDPGDPTRANYTFAGWRTSSSSNTAISFPYSPGVDADITLYAQWFSYSGLSPTSGLAGAWITLQGQNLSRAVENGFGYQTVYYRSVADSSGSSPGSWTALNGTAVRNGTGTSIEVNVPAVSGVSFYQFQIDVCANWTTTSGCVSLQNDAAIYSIASTYTVTYDGNQETGGVVPTDTDGPYLTGATVTLKNNSGNLVKDGYTFEGWNSQADGLGTSYAANGSATLSMSAANLTIYAKWAINPTPTPTPTPTPNTQSFKPQQEILVPGITWEPLDLLFGEAVGNNQHNATFTVPGNPIYSISKGEKPAAGIVTITVTFTPLDQSRYYVLSTSRTFKVLEGSSPPVIPTNPIVTNPGTTAMSQLKRIGIVYFNTNEYFLDVQDRKSLRAIASKISDSGPTVVYVEGNTDARKGVDNVWLSKSRAEAVSSFLQKSFSPPLYNRMWFAASRPAAPNITKADLALNRRVEIFVPQILDNSNKELSETPALKIAKSFPSITFNRNDYFLDAKDRVTLKDIVKDAADEKCTIFSLVGTRDQSIGVNNSNIAENRVNAVRRYITNIYPKIQFKNIQIQTSSVREVRISCSS